MGYSDLHPDPQLAGKPKGMKAILQVQESVWDEFVNKCGGRVVGKCKDCQKSEVKKDAERHVAAAEAMGQEDTLMDKDIAQADEVINAPENDWCCMHQVLGLQDNFANEKPHIQHFIEV